MESVTRVEIWVDEHLPSTLLIEELPFTNYFPELFDDQTEHASTNRIMKKTEVEPTKLQEQPPPSNLFRNSTSIPLQCAAMK